MSANALFKIDDRDVLCPCVSLTKGAALDAIARDPSGDFDSFLDATGAAKICTACRLDLEYFFVEAPKTRRPNAAVCDADEAETRRSWKQRFYALLDASTPTVPFNVTNWMPVFHGPGVTQYLVMSNLPLMFADTSEIVDFDINFTLRRGDGKVIHRDALKLMKGRRECLNISQYYDLSDEVAIGSVALNRRGRGNGVRGTTRPQIELATQNARASMHFQASGDIGNKKFTYPHRPQDEEIFFSIINCIAAPLKIDAQLQDYRSGEVLAIKRVELDAYQSLLMPPPTSAQIDRLEEGALVTAVFVGHGFGCLHVVSKARNEDRYSLDHI